MTTEEIFEFLRMERNRQKWTTWELSKRIGCNHTTLRKRETGTYNGCNVGSLIDWASALKCEVIIRRINE